MREKKCMVEHCDVAVREGSLCRHHVKRRAKFKLSVEGESYLVNRAGGKCELCGKEPEQTLHTDHNHATGKVRGLLCHHCNVGLGMFKEDIEVLRKAVVWLESDGLELPEFAIHEKTAVRARGSKYAHHILKILTESGRAMTTQEVTKAFLGEATRATAQTTRRGLVYLTNSGQVRCTPGAGREPDRWSALGGWA